MTTKVFVNFPVRDLEKSTHFYQQLGFEKNEMFSNEHANAMLWDDHFSIMLLTHDFYKQFLQGKTIADTQKTSAALIAFEMKSADAIKQFAKKAKENGGHYYRIDHGIPEEHMFGLEVLDLDGNTLEPMWMAPTQSS
ncbi:VOC family protein [Shouchella lehensis]|uniref:Glyoxalase n=1 Tax=Shouchella lehensis TaxID=300825 RepID=A0A4Y7WJ14_9BACI|nr:VOC family protein [Shouchella lehensis]MBG9785929.1 glyoxalase [Shouchella lehensis]TES48403.1 glyoxalase [Shouchella lehensis]